MFIPTNKQNIMYMQHMEILHQFSLLPQAIGCIKLFFFEDQQISAYH